MSNELIVCLCPCVARKKLEQVENGGCDREGSSMGSRSSSSGTFNTYCIKDAESDSSCSGFPLLYVSYFGNMVHEVFKRYITVAHFVLNAVYR